MITTNAYLLLSLMQLPGLGRKTLQKHFDILTNIASHDPDSIYAFVQEARRRTKRIKDYTYNDIVNALQNADKILEACKRLNIGIISYLDANYPYKLRTIDDPPVLLYYLGNIDILSQKASLAVIGTRQPTDYGYRIAKRIGQRAAESSIVTISGLAIGCDTGGHIGTVEAGGVTVAVLANGLDTIYPATNIQLADRILEYGGCLISEFAPFTKIQKGYFVDRDRLQAGLSEAIFVVETGIEGGTLHTVDFAVKYNRKVYCFNHPKTMQKQEKAKGNQMLITNGLAIPVGNKEEIENLIMQLISKPFNEKPLSDNLNEQDNSRKVNTQISLF